MQLNIDADISRPTRDAQLSVRVPATLKKRLRRMARDADRTLGDYVTLVLQEHVQRERPGHG